MQKPAWLRLLVTALRLAGSGLLTIGCWTLWLALGLALVVQCVIALSREFQVPQFLLRALEQRLAVSRIEARFGRALLDPTGGLLLENLQLSLPEFGEPVIRARAVYVELEPWPLLLGQVEARRVHATGVDVMVPAMLAASGRPEAGIADLDFDVSSTGRQLDVQQLTARAAGVRVAAHGRLRLPTPSRTAGVSPVPVLEDLAAHYADTARQLVRATRAIQALDDPQLEAVLTPLPAGGAHASLTLVARKLELGEFGGIAAREPRIEAETAVGNRQPAPLSFSASAAGGRVGAADLTAVAVHGRGRFAPASLQFTPESLQLEVGRAAAQGFAVDRLQADVAVGAWPRVTATALAEFAGWPLQVAAEADAALRTAQVRLQGPISPDVLTPIGQLLHRDLRPFVDFQEPVRARLDAAFAPGWRFAEVSGRVDSRHIVAHGVRLDAGGGDIRFDGRRFVARNAFVTVGENIARGSFEQDLRTLEYRFLLNGRLRPLEISAWFHDWWPEFFEHFEFPDAPPDASVDVTGRWKTSRESAVFLFVQSGRPTIRDARLDYARTLMFVRPNFYDAFELFGTLGAGELRGNFTLQRDPERSLEESAQLNFAFESTLDAGVGARLLGPGLSGWLAPFTFDSPPQISASGELAARPEDLGTWHRSIDLQARSTGRFTVYGLPAADLGLDARVKDDELVMQRVEAGVAGGRISGKLHVWGPADSRRLGFDAYLKNASLDQAITLASNYTARRHGAKEAAPADRFLTGTNQVSLDAALSAEGLVGQPYSFRGSGNASVAGTELGQIRLLGLLSELLNFTALRFTAARADFKLEGTKLVFPSFNVTGANSAIHAHGDYALDRHALDFNARVYPFEESKGFLQSMVGAVLTPFSAVFEVRLTGPLEQPKWAFVIGPTNLFNSLSQPDLKPADAAPPAPAETEPLKSASKQPMKSN